MSSINMQIIPLSKLDNFDYTFLAKLLAKTGFFEQDMLVNYPQKDPFALIADKFIIQNKQHIHVIFHKEEAIGFYMVSLIDSKLAIEDTFIPKNQINWSNLAAGIMQYYDMYFNYNEFLIDYISLIESYQGKGVFSNLLFHIFKSQAINLNASSMVLTVLEQQNANAAKLYLKHGFRQIAKEEFILPDSYHPDFGHIRAHDNLLFLRLKL